jgi:predicted short-subunit dehydrogenase-like oxidoreductase (DUF2520 family)
LFSEKLNIAFIGAGKIAYSLIAALIEAEYSVVSIISRNKSSAQKLAEKFRIAHHSNRFNSLNQNIKFFFLTVPDSQIEKVAKSLSKLNLNFEQSLFVHVSGALNIDELQSLRKKKGNIASFHIMQTFPSQRIIDIKNCSVAVEEEKKVVKNFLTRLALDLKLKPFCLKPDMKVYYHLAGVFASNFLVGNLSASGKMFKLTEAEKTNFFSVINSTVNSTLSNIRDTGPAKALSGPVERGDFETIERHLKALKKKDILLYKSYIVQSLNLLEVVKEKNGKLNEGQKRIQGLLSTLVL